MDRIEPKFTTGDAAEAGEASETGVANEAVDTVDAVDHGVTAEQYVAIIEAHRQALANDAENEPALRRARIGIASALLADPHQLVRLAVANTQALAAIDHDATANDVGDRAERTSRVLEILFAGDTAEPDSGHALPGDIPGQGGAPGSQTPDAQTALTDPIEGYALARRRMKDLADEPDAMHLAAAYAEHTAEIIYGDPLHLVRFGQIHPEMARLLAGDAKIDARMRQPEALDEARNMAAHYIDAERDVRAALENDEFSEYARLRAERLQAAASLIRNPEAMLALGQAGNEVYGRDASLVVGKLAADIMEVERRNTDATLATMDDAALQAAASDTPTLQHRRAFEQRLRDYEANFARDFTIEGSDPVKRYIAIQDEIKKQEIVGLTPANLVFLERLSEKTALEVAQTAANFSRLNEARPDLLGRMADEAATGRKSVATLGRESVVARRDDGTPVVNEAAHLRNAGESDEHIATARPEATLHDAKTRDPLRSGRFDQRAPEKPTEQVRSGGAKEAEPKAPASSQPGRPAASGPAASGPADRLLPRQPRFERGNDGEPEADDQHGQPAKDKRGFGSDYPKPNWDKRMLEYVHARTPKTLRGMQDQIRDHSTTTLALPLTSFNYDRNGYLKRELERVATTNPDHFRRMYGDTMKCRMDLFENGDMQSELTRERFDQLELGRRAMAEVGVRFKLLEPEKTAGQAHALVSQVGRKMPASHRRDDHDYIQTGNIKARTTLLTQLRDKTLLAAKKSAGVAGIGLKVAGKADKMLGITKLASRAVDELLSFR